MMKDDNRPEEGHQNVFKKNIKDTFDVAKTQEQPITEWLYSCEVQKMLRISRYTLKKLRDNKQIPYCLFHKTYRYPKEEVLKHLRGFIKYQDNE